MRVSPPLAFVLCSFIWGTTWLAIKIGYEGLDPVWGASLRFLLASLLLAPLVGARKLPPPIGRRQVGVVVFVGLVLFGLDYGLVYWGEQHITSGLTAILFATMPLWVALFSAGLIPSEHVSPRHLVGVLVGLLGLGLIFQPELRFGAGALGPMLAIVGGAAAAGVSSVVVRRWGRDLPPLVLQASAMFIGSVTLLLASLALGETPSFPRSGAAWVALLYLIAFGSIVSFLLYWDLLKVWTANRAGLIPILTPVVAVATGLLVGERLAPLQWLGGAIVLGGVALSLYRFPVRTPAPAPAQSGGK